MWKELLQLTGMLIAVGIILFLSWYLTRKLGSFTGRTGGGTGVLQVVDKVVLGQNEALAVIRAGSRFFLIGISPGGINCLRELDPPQADTSESGREGHPQPDFAGLLERLKKKL